MLNQQGGFIKIVAIIVITLIVLGFFGFNIQKIINSPTVSGNLNYAWGLTVNLWNKVIVASATWVWDKIIVPVFWNPLMWVVNKIGGKVSEEYKTPPLVLNTV